MFYLIKLFITRIINYIKKEKKKEMKVKKIKQTTLPKEI